MSIITTSASSFSAMLRAAVAPTLPAPPTTVTFRFIFDQHSCLGQFPSFKKHFCTEVVENPVEKDRQSRVCADQIEQISGLHHRGAIVKTPGTKPTDYTVST